MFKRVLLGLLFIVAAGTAAAQTPDAKGYTDLRTPLPVETSGKVEVIEFFWYGCPHCYALEPQLETWARKLPEDVNFKRVPAIFNEQWAVAARVFYALDALGLQAKLHRPLFDAIHKDHLRITNESQLNDWLSRQGVDTAKFSSAMSSFAVESRVRRARQMIEQAGIDGVPAIIVQGRMAVSMNEAQTATQLLATTDELIEQERKRMNAAASAPAPKAAAPATPKK